MAVGARDVRRQALGAEAAATKQREVERPWRRAEGTPAPWPRVDLYDARACRAFLALCRSAGTVVLLKSGTCVSVCARATTYE